MSVTVWQKSSYCAEANNCLELARAADEDIVLVRESQAPATELATTPARLSVLLSAARRGRLPGL